ncbi:hypothetical protein E8E13_002997 [Curvularia kusanoi]|uniref:Heterokaryon incompatibility domain-containing protein n=1 Tax=Curvularia kusanoi TaxID=90978 RepID=A0A9P4W2K6_CURKU|nr:hypothetical protein E8E13_002997 [Curvularia kusanoi]
MSHMPYPSYYREPLLPNTIRLLRLLPSKDRTGPIQCELFHYSLRAIDTRTHPYEALSYVWGRSENPQSISIRENDAKDGCRFTTESNLPITENLHAALLHLRYQTHDRVIWIDAVCINQNNEREKEQQIQFMAKIYALANRVIVWLGEAAEDSDRALHWIRSAGGSQSKFSSSNAADQQAVIALLSRPWFRRIWILQEVAAARHVLIMCGPTEIDGYAFCLGVDLFDWGFNAHADSKNLARSVTYLIRGAIFRPSFSISRSGRSSLDIRPLGELIDMYRTHEATVRHDKLYALLGMSTDDLGQTKLMPDYSLRWGEIFKQLIKYLLPENISVKIEEVDQELAVIKSKGCVFGKIARGDSEALIIRVNNGDKDVSLSLPPSAIFVRDGDVVCLLQGASTPMIIRQRQDHFEITAIYFDWSNFSRPDLKFEHDFILSWDWGIPSGETQYRQRYDQTLDLPKDSEASLEKMNRIWNVAHVLEDAKEYDGARDRFREAIHAYETAFGIHHTWDSKCGFTPLSWAARNGHDVAVRQLASKGGVDLDMKDRLNGRTLLSWAAQGGHETVVRLLLETGKAQVNSTDERSRTPLSWAAEGGHETVVKLLLETGEAEVDSTDKFSRTPLLWAAKRGHETVIKLLLETGNADVNSADNIGRTPLSWAAERGRETVVKLLLKTSNVDVNTRDVHAWTPIYWAAFEGKETTVKLLLETGKVNVNLRTRNGHTPLWSATQRGHTAIVKLLRKAGAVLADPERDLVRR